MPRKKRSEKGLTTEAAPRPVAIKTRVGTKVVAALCPCCGRAIPENRAIKVGSVTVDRINYFGSIEWDPDKAFGVRYIASGRGSFRDTEPIDPEDAPGLFAGVKKRFLDALGEWKNKGWISQEEVDSI